MKRDLQKLIVSNTDKIESHYRNQQAFIPAEFTTVVSEFNNKQKDYMISISGDLIDLGRQIFSFPDFVITNKNKNKNVKTYIELFHKWHKGPLIKRLNSMETTANVSSLVGVCRSIIKDTKTSKRID